jgi:hypothetical protein
MRPLKTWRYVGVFDSRLMLCLASVRIGPARQAFWAVWDRQEGRLYERTGVGGAGVTLTPGRARVRGRAIAIDLELAEASGVETVCASGSSYGWTRKQGGILATGSVRIGDAEHVLRARAMIDDTAAYYARHTRWRWSAGVGRSDSGRELAWNLVQGVNDPPEQSERTLWVDGEPHELPPLEFAADLSAVGALRFHAEAIRESNQNLGLLRSRYRQPFGTFRGTLPGGHDVVEGLGVMEDHDVWW